MRHQSKLVATMSRSSGAGTPPNTHDLPDTKVLAVSQDSSPGGPNSSPTLSFSVSLTKHLLPTIHLTAITAITANTIILSTTDATPSSLSTYDNKFAPNPTRPPKRTNLISHPLTPSNNTQHPKTPPHQTPLPPSALSLSRI